MNEILTAIFARLDSELTAPVYDHVPQDPTDSDYPYVKLGSLEPEDNGTDTETGFMLELEIFAYSRYRGMKEINDLDDQIYAALHRWAMPDTASYGISSIRERVRSVIMLDDGLTRESVQRIEIIFEPLPQP